MEKAYDVKVLVAKLKDQGLEIAEESAKILVDSVLDWVGESATVSENKIDDLIASFIPTARPFIDEQIDKINPADNI